MTTAADETSFARVPSGIAGIDTILGGGFMRGGIYIIQGNPGSGKTILTNQICFNHIAADAGGCAPHESPHFSRDSKKPEFGIPRSV
jgi:predicted ATP-dependent serine protease